MRSMSKNFIFSSEAVGEGHPDKVADYISDSILDACLRENPECRVACEVMVKSNCVYLAGEITEGIHIDFDSVVRQAIREIGYDTEDDLFHADKVLITNAITPQSPDIVEAIKEGGAGDQGIMFGYACDHTPEFMPAPIVYAHKITKALAQARKKGTPSPPWLRPDCKTQVAVRFENQKPVEITNIVLSTQHTADVSHKEIVEFCREEILKKTLPPHLLTPNTQYLINPAGQFIIGGPQGDAGLTGRKIIADTYGGWAHHGGGCFSGKDPSKVDRSAAYMARWLAKNIVAAGLAKEVEIQLAYAIGQKEPTSFNVTTVGSGRDNACSDEKLQRVIQKLYSLTPQSIIQQLRLLDVEYKQTTQAPFMGMEFPWEKVAQGSTT